MDFSQLTEKEQKEWAEALFAPLNSSIDLKDWARVFLDLEIPLEITDPDSNSSPLDAIWQIYKTFRDNSGDVNPGYILLSCREGMKTVSVAILEMLLMLHFQLEIAHAAATEEQSSVCISYINGFINKVDPLLKISNWVSFTKNKRTIKYKTPQFKTPYIKILICTPKGMNSLHANVIFLDELDLADPKALKEGKNITGYSKGIYGVTVYLSTRKYAFGNMTDAIDSAAEKNYKILNWNILDVTEACPPARHRPDEPKQDMYVHSQLPLRQMVQEEYDAITDAEKLKWHKVENAHAGCKGCLLLPVCKKRLSEKPQSATGGFYKPIVAVMQKFRDNDPDTAEAQLMCWKPGSEGLIYPRFNNQVGKGNVSALKELYDSFTGSSDKTIVTMPMLVQALKEAGVPFYAGVDWGYTHDFVICVVAILPNGEVWLIETFASPGLEFADQLEIAKGFRDKYPIVAWFCDQAMPSHCKSFTKNGMKSPKFTKDVLGGIESIRSKIVGADGSRLFKVLNTIENRKTITALGKHRFLLDGQGNPTMTPDDDRGIADICDTLRYIGQNKFPVKGHTKPLSSMMEPTDPNVYANQDPTVTLQMKQEIQKRLGDTGNFKGGTGKKGGFHWIV